ncbi:S-adenosyl-L-methionine-dependent methyltransferase, partial [Baffinella frigidus]
YEEQVTEELVLKMALTTILFEGESQYQRIQVVETVPFGKTLVLDDHTQSAALDERSYHEALVHPAMLAHGSPKRVFIGGGGEGATAREVLKWTSVEQVVMVDLDEVACKQCREHLPTWNEGVYEDPRFEIYYEDALAFLKNYKGPKFDVVIMDISDPIECGPGIELYFKGFYESLAREQMSEGAVFVTQSGACGMLSYEEVFTTIHATVRSSFTHVHGYAADIPCFGCPWGYSLPSKVDGCVPRSQNVDFRKVGQPE